jgi:hypothetical protein
MFYFLEARLPIPIRSELCKLFDECIALFSPVGIAPALRFFVSSSVQTGLRKILDWNAQNLTNSLWRSGSTPVRQSSGECRGSSLKADYVQLEGV